MSDHDYRCKCPLCGDSLIIRLDSIDCTNCDYSRPRRQCEDMVEVRKLGEPMFVPPRQPHAHPNKRVIVTPKDYKRDPLDPEENPAYDVSTYADSCRRKS